jgi:hypothetical protein
LCTELSLWKWLTVAQSHCVRRIHRVH